MKDVNTEVFEKNKRQDSLKDPPRLVACGRCCVLLALGVMETSWGSISSLVSQMISNPPFATIVGMSVSWVESLVDRHEAKHFAQVIASE